MHMVGRIWIWFAVFWITLSYFLNLIYSNEPIANRILVFINIWNVFIALIIILPGYLLTEASEKVANRSGDSFKKPMNDNLQKGGQVLIEIINSKAFFLLGAFVFIAAMVFFVLSHH